MSRSRKNQEQVSNEQVRKELEQHVQAYLDAGHKIEQVPTGFSNQDPLGGRRHIVLGPSKRT